jgi:GH24 family phage-related lysozyme (muramidase)
MKDLAGALEMLKTYEGCFPFMYLDSKGLVTVGVGFLLDSADSAAAYSFLLNHAPQAASPDQIMAEWNHLKSQATPHLETYYQPFTTMQMQQADIDAMLTQKVNIFEGVARKTFANWDDFPVPAQLALIDMIYNLGSLSGFPMLVAYAKAQDWANCAAQCFRIGPNAQRNQETKDRFLAAAQPTPLPPMTATSP